MGGTRPIARRLTVLVGPASSAGVGGAALRTSRFPKAERPAALRGRRSASDGGNACGTLRPRDFHDTGVRARAGEPRMRTGESLPGGGIDSLQAYRPHLARVPVIPCGTPGNPAPSARVIPVPGTGPGLELFW